MLRPASNSLTLFLWNDMRYFFQWMILITMAISLAACSGSSGSDGAAGADGTIAVPTATATVSYDNISAVDDTNYALSGYTPGQAITVTVDNVTDAGSRLRYYLYWATGTTSSDRTAEAEATDDLTNTGGQILSLIHI